MATKTYLEITDGALSAVLADGAGGATSYQFAYGGWAPAVAAPQVSQLAGRGPYDDVVEEITVNVTGATVDAVLANISTLIELIDRAERWRNGDLTWSPLPAAPVLIKYSPGGSTVSSAAAPMQAVILGRAAGDSSPVVNLPGTFESKLLVGGKYVLGVRVRFLRRGEWLHTTETASSSATPNGDLAAIALTARSIKSPTKVTVTNVGLNSASAGLYDAGFIAVSDQFGVGVIPAESFTGTDITAYNDSAKNARNTNVLRFTPTATTERIATYGPATVYGRVLAVLANVRINNTAAVSFDVRLGLNGVYAEARRIVAPAAQVPHWYLLGVVAVPDNVAAVSSRTLALGVKANQLGTIMDIDSLVVLDLSNPNSSLIAFNQTGDLAGTTPDLVIDHQILSKPWPLLSIGATYPAVSYSGNATLLTKTDAPRAVLMQCGGDVDGGMWRAVESGAVVSNTWTLARTTAYLNPV